jgi:hypothetical protein
LNQKLRAREGIAIASGSCSAILLVGPDCYEIKTDGSFSPYQAWFHLRDDLPPSQIAKLLGCKTEAVELLISQLIEQGVYTRREDMREFPRDAAIKILRNACTMLKRHMHFHQIFYILGDSELHPALLSALLVEVFQYVKRIPIIDATFSGNLTDRRAINLFQEYNKEERDHFRELQIAVSKLLNVSPSVVDAAPPETATIGLLAFLEKVARTDAIGYLSTLLITEADPQDAQLAYDDFVELGPKNGIDSCVTSVFADHMMKDGNHNHYALATDLLQYELPDVVPKAQLDISLNNIHAVKHSFELLYDSLIARFCEPNVEYRLRQQLCSITF